ncbi:hypothetical protein ARMGADRAFT_719145 [Armillaria gallica]|uniref:Uncharacterized protein n=1 Tax=Armillaria gallica TaxID=47427 RepID=A0A2H3DST4_ARMGA|nr:hypothetical protein ARMGADRAFT_719145 [Armillaria gallica]
MPAPFSATNGLGYELESFLFAGTPTKPHGVPLRSSPLNFQPRINSGACRLLPTPWVFHSTAVLMTLKLKPLVLELNLRISFRFITMLLFSIASGLIQLIPPISRRVSWPSFIACREVIDGASSHVLDSSAVPGPLHTGMRMPLCFGH